MRGNFGRAWELIGAALATAREFGLDGEGATASITSGRIAMLDGSPRKAEQEFSRAMGYLRTVGDLGHLSSVAPLLADALYEQGRDDEALSLTEEAERATIEGDIDAQVHWRRARAKIMARGGELAAARRLAMEAVEMARLSDDLDKRGQALLDLAEVLDRAGLATEASAAAREALDAFELKGNVVKAKAAREFHHRLAGPG